MGAKSTSWESAQVVTYIKTTTIVEAKKKTQQNPICNDNYLK